MALAARITAPNVAAVCAATALAFGVEQAIAWQATLHGHHEVSRTRSDSAVLQCLDRRLHKAVPDGSRVAVGYNSALFDQRLVEWSTPALQVLPDQRGADYVLFVRHVPRGACSGLDVVARRQVQ